MKAHLVASVQQQVEVVLWSLSLEWMHHPLHHFSLRCLTDRQGSQMDLLSTQNHKQNFEQVHSVII